ncbi:MAG: zf-HC2 domain-containing protein, partial [Myxococcales bacterium]|nr:zf-HC2 domain-containing protein [Myxococcales bacterium]
MNIGCADLDNFFDGELGGEQAAKFRAHLGGCEPCQRVLHGRMQEAVLVDGAPDVRVPDVRAVRRRR